MLIPKLTKTELKSIQTRLKILVKDPFFKKDINEIRKKWGINNAGIKLAEIKFYAKLFSLGKKGAKQIPFFHKDILALLREFTLTHRYYDFIHSYIFTNSIESLHSLKYLAKLSPILINPCSVDKYGDMNIALHLYGETSRKEYIAAWKHVSRYIKDMKLKSQQLKKYKNYYRDKFFYESYQGKGTTDSQLANTYDEITGVDVAVDVGRNARKRFKKWTEKYEVHKKLKPEYGFIEKIEYLIMLVKENPIISYKEAKKIYYNKFSETLKEKALKTAKEVTKKGYKKCNTKR
jgi:hypothetical protein